MDNFDNMVNSETPILVDFFATWCGPCKMMHPILEQLKQRMGDRVRIIKIDVDASANQPLANHYQVRSIPTLMVFREGRVVWRHVGAADLETLVRAIENA